MLEQKRKYGLIGKNINYSFSKTFFEDKFQKEDIKTCSYENYDLKSIKDFKKILKDQDIKGLNVTIPYKEKIMVYIKKIDPVAKKIGFLTCYLKWFSLHEEGIEEVVVVVVEEGREFTAVGDLSILMWSAVLCWPTAVVVVLAVS